MHTERNTECQQRSIFKFLKRCIYKRNFVASVIQLNRVKHFIHLTLCGNYVNINCQELLQTLY